MNFGMDLGYWHGIHYHKKVRKQSLSPKLCPLLCPIFHEKTISKHRKNENSLLVTKCWLLFHEMNIENKK